MSVFKYFNYLALRQKSEKTDEPFLRKLLNCWTDRQADNSDFIGISFGWGPIIKTTLSFPEFI